MSGEAIDPTGILKRRENFGKHLPKDVAIITAGVDVQDNRLELEIVGWGKDEESWSLDYQVIYGCLLYTSPSPRDRTRSRMPSSA